jgi:hypothetical protein
MPHAGAHQLVAKEGGGGGGGGYPMQALRVPGEQLSLHLGLQWCVRQGSVVFRAIVLWQDLWCTLLAPAPCMTFECTQGPHALLQRRDGVLVLVGICIAYTQQQQVLAVVASPCGGA